jgi:hypothetical protein
MVLLMLMLMLLLLLLLLLMYACGQVVWRAVTLALDTATACLQVLAAPGMPTQLYTEELMTSTIELTKTQLQYNILAFCDPKYQRLYRPSLTAGMRLPKPSMEVLSIMCSLCYAGHHLPLMCMTHPVVTLLMLQMMEADPSRKPRLWRSQGKLPLLLGSMHMMFADTVLPGV